MKSGYCPPQVTHSVEQAVETGYAVRVGESCAMVTVEDFSRLVSGIYAAAVTPQHWEPAIRDIHRTMGGMAGRCVGPTVPCGPCRTQPFP